MSEWQGYNHVVLCFNLYLPSAIAEPGTEPLQTLLLTKTMEVESVNKLDAACRQLDTAISLWFNDGDTVSIHTLACSAHQIVHDINKQRGNPALLHGGLIYDSLKIRDEYRREANRLLKGAYNFFKHAEKDASGTIEFRPALTELFIMCTSLGLELLGRDPGPIRAAGRCRW